ncbi:MAG: ureidoglycolate lyase [Paracoccaceae bacterium]
MTQIIKSAPLTSAAFAPYGDVLDTSGSPDLVINQGSCDRFHDRAVLDFDAAGRAGISILNARPVALPLTLEMVERHQNGSQAFIPMSGHRYLVVVAADNGGEPSEPRAFIAGPAQAINLHRNVWHGVLTPLDGASMFAVIDRIATSPNLQEHWFETAYVVE